MSNKNDKGQSSYQPMEKLSEEDAIDALNHLHREIATLLGFKNYHHRNYDNTSVLIPIEL